MSAEYLINPPNVYRFDVKIVKPCVCDWCDKQTTETIALEYRDNIWSAFYPVCDDHRQDFIDGELHAN